MNSELNSNSELTRISAILSDLHLSPPEPSSSHNSTPEESILVENMAHLNQHQFNDQLDVDINVNLDDDEGQSRLHLLPSLKQREAPPKFLGGSSYITDFLDLYEGLIAKNSLVLESDKVSGILKYCGSEVRQFIKTLPSYRTPDWQTLKNDLLRLYDAERTERRWTIADVQDYAEKSSRRTLTDKAAWLSFLREYWVRAGQLKSHNKMSDTEFGLWFWAGLSRELRNIIEPELRRREPDHDQSKPYPFDTVTSVLDEYFRRDKFDTRIPNPERYGVSRLPEHTYDEEDSDIDEEEDEEEYYHRSRSRMDGTSQRKPEKKMRKLEAKKVRTKSVSPRRRYTEYKGTREEIQELLKDLKRMKTSDPDYTANYFRLLTMDVSGMAASLVPKPTFSEPEPSRLPPVRQPMSSRPPTMSRAFEATVSPAQNNAGSSNAQFDEWRNCFGCGIPGHSVRYCPAMNELKMQGLVIWDFDQRKWLWRADGSMIMRDQNSNETLKEAVLRRQEQSQPSKTARVHLLCLEEEPTPLKTVRMLYTRILEEEEEENSDEDWRTPDREDQYADFDYEELSDSETEGSTGKEGDNSDNELNFAQQHNEVLLLTDEEEEDDPGD